MIVCLSALGRVPRVRDSSVATDYPLGQSTYSTVGYGGASRTSVVEGGGALWRARRSISPREKRRPLGGVGQSPARCHRPSRRRPGGTNGRMRALSPGACRGSLGLGRIKALAAQLDAHLGPIDANALRRTSARPCSASHGPHETPRIGQSVVSRYVRTPQPCSCRDQTR